jgi:hypothetical protein
MAGRGLRNEGRRMRDEGRQGTRNVGDFLKNSFAVWGWMPAQMIEI